MLTPCFVFEFRNMASFVMLFPMEERVDLGHFAFLLYIHETIQTFKFMIF